MTQLKVEQRDIDVDILLSTFNGANYLKEQLESILSQTYPYWRLIIRDDGSTDDTLEIINGFIEQERERVLLITDDFRRLGPSLSFSTLLSRANAPYVMLCDQDDVWLPDKIEISRAKMKNLEKENPEYPILIHTDLQVVDAALNKINDSFWKFQNIDPRVSELGTLLVQNNVTGCTVMINHQLKKLAYPIPRGAIMHDWWLALVASAFGHIEPVKSPSLKYRQHASNQVGASAYGFKLFLGRIAAFKTLKRSVDDCRNQAGEFLDKFHDLLSKNQVCTLEAFQGLSRGSFVSKLYRINKYKLHKQGLIRRLAFVVVVALTYES
ncbi:glycosyltransferase family 2 protein [Alicyclobacillus sp. SO9]|uniref:glycosyltransferase family 2 protein n=1 Tax=Alicyclobacillus sp. SO9 TaxID=2665646 RepID=UPI0018E73993|nr:glycosyltransferase family 2 protein [Alicyclobacillus sp. SO9]QQE79208.1 glycosyltransferase family 2 protein [Alicyclobacillus sp. SO9]